MKNVESTSINFLSSWVCTVKSTFSDFGQLCFANWSITIMIIYIYTIIYHKLGSFCFVFKGYAKWFAFFLDSALSGTVLSSGHYLVQLCAVRDSVEFIHTIHMYSQYNINTLICLKKLLIINYFFFFFDGVNVNPLKVADWLVPEGGRHRRWIDLEDKAKVVASDWGTYSLPR